MTTENETFAEVFGKQQDILKRRVETRRDQRKAERERDQERDHEDHQLYALGEIARIDGDLEKFKGGLK